MSRKGAVSVCRRLVAMLNTDDCFSADSFDFAAADAIVLMLLDLLKVGGNNLKLQTRASGVQDKDVHCELSRATIYIQNLNSKISPENESGNSG